MKYWKNILIAIASMILINQIFLIVDEAFTVPVTNTTGQVVHKKFLPVYEERQLHYALVVASKEEAWVFRVPRALWDDIRIGDHVYLTRHTGRITGQNYRTTLYNPTLLSHAE